MFLNTLQPWHKVSQQTILSCFKACMMLSVCSSTSLTGNISAVRALVVGRHPVCPRKLGFHCESLCWTVKLVMLRVPGSDMQVRNYIFFPLHNLDLCVVVSTSIVPVLGGPAHCPALYVGCITGEGLTPFFLDLWTFDKCFCSKESAGLAWPAMPWLNKKHLLH